MAYLSVGTRMLKASLENSGLLKKSMVDQISMSMMKPVMQPLILWRCVKKKKRTVQSEVNGTPDFEVYGEAFDAANMEVCQEEKRKKVKSVKWSSDDSKTVNRYFEETIISDARNNKGSLPSKGCRMGFLKKNNLPSLAGLDINEQYKKVRTKLFNDWKTLRRKAEKTSRL